MTSVTETLYQLKKTVGNPLHIYGRWYRSQKYTIGLDLGKISGAGFTGLSTKSCDKLIINFKDCDAGNFVSSVPARVYCALHYDCVLNIADQGIQLLD